MVFMSIPKFTKQIIGEVKNDIAPAAMNTFSEIGDIDGDGYMDYIVCGRNGKMVWLENNKKANGQWKQHFIDEVEAMECGGSVYDLTGSGCPDIINGGDYRSDGIFWWENPGRSNNEGENWTKRLICRASGGQIHDTAIGDITGDGTNALIFTNQLAPGGTSIYYIPLPSDPRISPWADVQIIASGKSEPNPQRYAERPDFMQPEEGLAIGDIDGDGINELVCGTCWYKYNGSSWSCHKFASGYITTKCAIGDINGDGKNEILLSEGDPCIYGKNHGGKIAWFSAGSNITGMWEEHILEDYLFDAHSLQLGDICKNGRLDIFVGEVGKNNANRKFVERPPRLIVYENDGLGNFVRHIIDEGTGTHEARLCDLRNSGSLDIIGKPLAGDEIWNVHVWYNDI